ncbi:hypothetical protein MRS76_25240 [Rhizobiaceae bacterium n13]|uniref:Glycerophosphoryl diester phosphodiesterase membrane domain-containing protein n=1 Tax=Ferirhizobium litorale TaxID=2927786 RepID=A0AAE3QCX8_9HYPH|nr:hypothetical protein [Fererhizobium litorale]MDI7865212.1 hypothetical protein [Fererhizobium litorale]MDI7922840.1 hypothetical protein [Fererhizobium litorale]
MREATGKAMAVLSKVSTHFRVAFAYRVPFIVTHLAVRLVTSALFLPLIGLLLGTVVGFSGRSATTDQDIAHLLLTPAGAFAVPRFPHILRFSLGLLLRVVAIALPFVLAMAATAYWSLRDHDINYYLTYLPPRALLPASAIAALSTLMGLILLSRLTGWAFALQLIVGRGVRPWAALKENAALLRGRKLILFWQIVVWITFRFLMAAAIAALFGAMIGGAPSLLGGSLRLIAGVTFFFLLVWGVMNTFVSALSNGALARLLLSEFPGLRQLGCKRRKARHQRYRVRTISSG